VVRQRDEGESLAGSGPGLTASGAILASVEDSSSKSTVKRLAAHDAVLNRVFDASRIGPDRHPLRLPGDIGAIERMLSLHDDIRFVALDPLGACSDIPVTSPRIRLVIDELREVAERREVAVLLSCHMTKTTGELAGHAELENSARSILVVANGEIRAVKESYAPVWPQQPAVVFELGAGGRIRWAS
jgi:hypothetical protein